uniref:AAA family ATPase n=1 Tax=Amycolatopsis sp. CA-096443 TaxID=3239919 RepID=UPI003F491375
MSSGKLPGERAGKGETTVSEETRWPAAGLSLDRVTAAIAESAPCVVMMFGAPGSGKSALSAALAHELGDAAAVLSYAAHREEICGDPAEPAANPRAGALLRARLADRCAAGRTTVLDGTHHHARTRRRVRDIAAAAGLPAVAVVLSTPLQVCLDRQHDRPPPAPGKQHGLKVPAPEVREVHAALREALPGLAGEGFRVHVLAPHATTAPDSRD